MRGNEIQRSLIKNLCVLYRIREVLTYRKAWMPIKQVEPISQSRPESIAQSSTRSLGWE